MPVPDATSPPSPISLIQLGISSRCLSLTRFVYHEAHHTLLLNFVVLLVGYLPLVMLKLPYL